MIKPFILVFLAAPSVAVGQAASDMGWSYSGKLTAVWAGGNSQSSTFGLGSMLRRLGERAELTFETGAIRTDASLRTRRAVGTASAYTIEEDEDNQKTAESYFARARQGWKVKDNIVAFAGADWLRNTFAGIDSRTLFATGVGNVWSNSETFKFKTDLGVTYTFQQDVVENPFVKSNFPGVRFAWDLQRALSKTSKWESTLVSDLNLDDTEDLRFDFSNGLPVSISNRLSLKPALQLLWRNRPALTNVDLFTPLGTSSGQVQVPLQKLDSFFTLALVVTL